MRILDSLWLLFIFLWTVLSVEGFEKNIFAYWDKPITEAPLTSQLCYYRIKFVAERSGYNFTLLSKENVKEHISDQEGLQNYEKYGKVRFPPSYSDMLRIFVLEEHGGIWIDLSSVFHLDNMDWIEDILDKDIHLVSNNFAESPDFLICSYGLVQNSFEYTKNHNGRQIWVNEYPAGEIWFMAAKKQTPAVKLLKQNFIFFYSLEYPQAINLLSDHDILLKGQQDVSSYLSGTFAFEYMLESYQKKLDKESLTLLTPRKSVFEELRIWFIKAEYGAFSFSSNMASIFEMVEKTIDEVEKDNDIKLRFFNKLTRDPRNFVNEVVLTQARVLQKSGFNMTKFIQNKPTPQDCQKLKLTVSGSVYGKLLESGTDFHYSNIRAISVQDRQNFREYCRRQAEQIQSHVPPPTFLNKLSMLKQLVETLVFRDLVLFLTDTKCELYEPLSHRRYAKIEYAELHEKQDLSIGDYVSIYYRANRFLLFVVVKNIAIPALFFAAVVVCLKILCWLFNFVLRFISEIERSSGSNENLTLDKSQSAPELLAWDEKRRAMWLWLLTVGLAWGFYVNVDLLNRFGQDGKTLILFVWVWFVKLRTSGKFRHMVLDFSIESIMIRLSAPALNFSLAYCILNLTIKRQCNLVFPVLMVGLVAPLLLDIIEIQVIEDQDDGIIHYRKFNEYLGRVKDLALFYCNCAVFAYLVALNTSETFEFFILESSDTYLLRDVDKAALLYVYVLVLFVLVIAFIKFYICVRRYCQDSTFSLKNDLLQLVRLLVVLGLTFFVANSATSRQVLELQKIVIWNQSHSFFVSNILLFALLRFSLSIYAYCSVLFVNNPENETKCTKKVKELSHNFLIGLESISSIVIPIYHATYYNYTSFGGVLIQFYYYKGLSTLFYGLLVCLFVNFCYNKIWISQNARLQDRRVISQDEDNEVESENQIGTA